MTEDFALSYDLMRILKRRGIAFKSLDFRDPMPADVGAVITGEGEGSRVAHPRVVEAGDDREAAVSDAVQLMTGRDTVRVLVVGIDPGERRIGFALLADGTVLEAKQMSTVGEVKEGLDGITDRYASPSYLVRVGHGAPTIRNRIVNAALRRGLRVEIADETSTTRRVDLPDVEAAITIAGLPGVPVEVPLVVSPSRGELKHLKKRSRELSNGEITISTQLARRVALGDITLSEAIAIMRGGNP